MGNKLEECVLELHSVGVVKFGNFKLKSGMMSPVYFDLRMITSYPKLLCTVSELLWSAAPSDSHYDHLCGVAYTGIPLATVISQQQGLPMVVRRKESKSYGLKKLVEGVYMAGDSCLIVEDVLVSGGSVYETVESLVDLELRVTDAVVFLDREQGGRKNLAQLGVSILPVLTLTQMLSILLAHGRVTKDVAEEVKQFVATHCDTSITTSQQKEQQQTKQDGAAAPASCPRLSLPLIRRSSPHPLTSRLFSLMESKRTNLCVAADVATAQELLDIAAKVGPHVCILKTHVDTLPDFTCHTAAQLRKLAQEFNFLLFEDRKFVDIGATVSRQYRQQGLWADLVTAAPVLGGDGVVRGLEVEGKGKGVVLVAEMSSEGALRSQDYVAACLQMAKDHPAFVMGFVCQSNITADPGLVQMTPGVSLTAAGDVLGQRYVSPRVAVTDRGADVIIVGRGVTQAEDVAAAALLYQKQGFAAFQDRLKE